MHIDINSCFATIEQQANPYLRDKYVAVAAYATNNGCILAASYNAKRLGVKTGMGVKEGRKLCPGLIVLPPDPNKYRFVHHRLFKILKSYSPIVVPKSIDEFIIDFSKNKFLPDLKLVAVQIKNRIRKEVGEFISVSIGISTNRFLAKTAASYKKPDGLFVISKENHKQVFSTLNLTDLCGIKKGNASRLSIVNIFSVMDFYNADITKLKFGFRSVTGYYWYLRLHGFEVDEAMFGRKSFGNSYALPKPYYKFEDLAPILTKLIEKMAIRLRRKNYIAQGVHLGIWFRDNSFWHKGKKLANPIFASSDFRKEIFKLLFSVPKIKPVRNLSVTCFDLHNKNFLQLDLTSDVIKKVKLCEALDNINGKWGDFTVVPTRMINNESYVLDRIAFGITE